MSGYCEHCGNTGCTDDHAPPSDATLTAYTEASQSLGQRDDDPNPLAKDAGRVVAWMVADGRLYVDTVYPSLERAEKSQQSRNDGAVIKPLVLASDLDAVRAELDAEIEASDSLRQQRIELEQALTAMRLERNAKEQQCERLREALESYGGHMWDCKKQRVGAECNCGFDAALATGGRHDSK